MSPGDNISPTCFSILIFFVIGISVWSNVDKGGVREEMDLVVRLGLC